MKGKATNENVKVGDNIRLWRERKRMKQEVLAKEIGITSVALSNIENNKSDISISRLFQIAQILEIKPTLLIAEDPLQYFVFNNCSHSNNGINYNSVPEEIIAMIVDKLRK
jgi:transcriptional regulator with XRE-family HTH domain